ncbi:hypothetical protein P8X24_10525 [Pyrococcus kukulkanii]|uniref:hypothetical protein n=1 Tax=Pyrococcus kukulkanii TaxID=1609559 RepID=UPI003568D62B
MKGITTQNTQLRAKTLKLIGLRRTGDIKTPQELQPLKHTSTFENSPNKNIEKK